jgi:hypothetical protein
MRRLKARDLYPFAPESVVMDRYAEPSLTFGLLYEPGWFAALVAGLATSSCSRTARMQARIELHTLSMVSIVCARASLYTSLATRTNASGLEENARLPSANDEIMSGKCCARVCLPSSSWCCRMRIDCACTEILRLGVGLFRLGGCGHLDPMSVFSWNARVGWVRQNI